MNLASVWIELDADDKKILIHAIDYYGASHRKSYISQFVGGKYNSPKMPFLKLRPVLCALNFYNANHYSLIAGDKERIARMIELLDIAVWKEYCGRGKL